VKCKIEIRRQNIDYFTVDSLWGNLKRSARQHGYGGLWGTLYFSFWAAIDYVVLSLAMYCPLPPSARIWIHRRRGVKIGKNTMIGLNVYLDIAFPNFITIGSNVSLAGWNCVLCHSTPNPHFSRVLESYVAPVIIDDGAWLATGAIILPGVTVGKASMVSAGAVVTKDVPPYTIVEGAPAKVIGQVGSLKKLVRTLE